MKAIDWSLYNPDIFTRFCNSLIYFEFGHHSIPYSAPGKDGGIDGEMINGNKHLRFQYKFKLTASSAAFSSLKADLQKEYNKITDEVTDYVLITNVQLLPNWIKQLQELWNELSQGKANLVIWEGAKLNTFIVANPLLRLWLNEGFVTMQLTYFRDHFSLQLQSNPLEAISLNNYYVKNLDLEDSLYDFINSDKILFNLLGEAGLGKTRGIVEFFKILENKPDEKWILLVLSAYNISYDNLFYALSGEGNHIILIDDAHTFEETVIRDLFAIALKGKNLKLIFTSRRDMSTSIKEVYHNRIKTEKIEALNQEQTREILLHYLSNSTLRVYIDELVHFSYGKPIVIVAMINNLLKRKDIKILISDDFLQVYVNNYFKDLISEISKETGYSNNKLLDVISILSLIEPLNINNKDELNQIGNSIDLTNEDLQVIFKILIDKRIVDGQSSIMIKPDLYSDIILSKANRQKLTIWMEYFSDKISNILVNLSSSVPKDENEDIFLAFSQAYLDSIDNVADKIRFFEISSTIFKIGGHFPMITKKLIWKYIEKLSDSENTFSKELIELSENNFQSRSFSNIAISEIVRHLSVLLLNSIHYDFVFDAVFEIQKKFNASLALNSLYNFGKVDYYDGFVMRRQSHFLEKIDNKLFNKNEISLIVQILSSFLKLEFMITESAFDRLSVNMTTFRVPENTNTVLLRQRTIRVLINYFDKTEAEDLRLEVLKNIIEVPREIFSNYKKQPSYNGKEEIDLVLSFLLKNSEKFNTIERNIVGEQLRFFELWDVSKKHSEFLRNLQEALVSKSLTEKVISLLSRYRPLDRKKPYSEIKDDLAVDIKNLVSKESPEGIARALIEAFEIKGNKLTNLYLFTQEIITYDISFLNTFYHELLDDKVLFKRIAPDIIRAIRDKTGGNSLYLSIIRSLFYSEDSTMNSVFLLVFSSLTDIYDKDFSIMEIEMMKSIINKKAEDNGFEISQLIPTLVNYDYTLGRETAINFFQYCSQIEAEYTFMYLQYKEAYSLIKELLIEHSYRFHISYEIEIAMNLILKKEGSDLLINYLNRRFLNFVDSIRSMKPYSGVQYLPSNHSSALFEDVEELRTDFFKKALNWFIGIEDKNLVFFARQILSYIASSDQLSDDLQMIVEKKSLDYKEDFNVQNKLMLALEEFIVKEERFIDLILKIYELGIENKSIIDNQQIDQFNAATYSAIINKGVQIGTPGEPFADDLMLLEIFNRKILNYYEFSKTHKLLSNAIASTKDSINRSNNSDFLNETWF